MLYLSLEDGERRLKDRIQRIMGTEIPDSFYYDTEWPSFEHGGLASIEEWLKSHPQARLVVVDTLAKVRAPQRTGENIYDRDYQSVQGLKRLAEIYHVTILIIHHTRKADASDAVETISGSFGLSGGVDGAVVLKRERSKADAVLAITGRDVEEKELALSFKFPHWELLGDADEFRLSQERQNVLTVLREAKHPMSPKEITEAIKDKKIKCTYDSIHYLLTQLANAGNIKKTNYGSYEQVEAKKS